MTAYKKKITLVLYFLFWCLFFSLLWQKMLFLDDQGLWAGWVNVWGDWAAHLTFTTAFAYGDNFSFKMPILVNRPLSYPFMADLISGILVKFGLPLIKTLIWQSFFLSIIFVSLYFYFALKITKNFQAAFLAPFIFLFNGGLGFIYFFQDLKKESLTALLTSLPHEYTNIESVNIKWINHLTSELIPQRSLLLGLPFLLMILVFLWSKNKKNLFRAGLLIGLLPLIHFHFFFSSLVIGGGLFLFELIDNFKGKKIKSSFWQKWRLFILPIVLLATPQILYFYPQFFRASFLRLYPGWLAFNRENWLFFWLKNQGFLFFLIPLGFLKASPRIKKFFVPFFMLFLLGNLLIFQPWPWDNTKIFTVYFLLGAVLASLAIDDLLKRKSLVFKFLGLILFFSLILSGLLDNLRLFQYAQRRLLFFNTKQLELAAWVKANTVKKALFLTSDNHDHPIPVLTGRPIILGFRGWLWTYGLDYNQEESDVFLMFKGGAISKALLQKYGVDYVFIGPFERKTPWFANQVYFEKNFDKVYDKGEFQIYKID